MSGQPSATQLPRQDKLTVGGCVFVLMHLIEHVNAAKQLSCVHWPQSCGQFEHVSYCSHLLLPHTEQTPQSCGHEMQFSFADEYRTGQLPALQAAASKASADGSQDLMAAQDYQDAVQALDRLEKRVLYLQQARQIAIQQLPQIRIVQNGDSTLIESLQASINLTIPVWKQKMVLLLGLTRQQEALAMQKTVTDTTNQMLKQASEMMKSQAVEIEQQSQRGIVDIDTLAQTNQEQANAKATALAHEVGKRALRWGKIKLKVSAAFGVYSFSGSDDAHVAIEAADKAMYQQKRVASSR